MMYESRLGGNACWDILSYYEQCKSWKNLPTNQMEDGKRNMFVLKYFEIFHAINPNSVGYLHQSYEGATCYYPTNHPQIRPCGLNMK